MSAYSVRSKIDGLMMDLAEIRPARTNLNLQRLRSVGENDFALDLSGIKELTPAILRFIYLASELCRKSNSTLFFDSLPALVSLELEALELSEVLEWDEGKPRTSSRAPSDSKSREMVDMYADRFSVDAKCVRSARKDFVAWLHDLPVVCSSPYILGSMFYEISTNIVNHGQLSKHESILFLARVFSEKILLTYVDYGVEFNVMLYKPPNWPIDHTVDRKRQGFGIPMILKLADDIRYRRWLGGLNVLSIERRSEEKS